MVTIFEACRDGNLVELKKRIAEGKRTNTKDNQEQRTPLQWAVLHGHENIMQYLLNLNIQDPMQFDLLIDYRDRHGKTAKEYAIDHKKQGNSVKLNLLNDWKHRRYLPVLQATSAPGANCSWKYLRTTMMKVDKHVIKNGNRVADRYPICSETLHTRLEHHSRKTGHLKWSLPVNAIHHQLRVDLNTLNNQDGNLLAVDITFEWKRDTETTYQQVTFPMKIVGHPIFTMTEADTIVARNSNQNNAYPVLKDIYNIGSAMSHAQRHNDHGHKPEYDSNNPAYQQYKNHSEQALVAYLSTKEAVTSLVNRLRTLLHEQNVPSDQPIKIYAVMLHMHSDKTTCGTCEQVLLGFQNDRTVDAANRGYYLGFIEQMEAQLLADKTIYRFRIPTSTHAGKTPGLRCYVTFSANSPDGTTHRNRYGVGRAPNEVPTPIEVSTVQSANQVHTALYRLQSYTPGIYNSTVPNRTFFSSASADHKATPDKKEKYKRENDADTKDMNQLFERIGFNK